MRVSTCIFSKCHASSKPDDSRTQGISMHTGCLSSTQDGLKNSMTVFFPFKVLIEKFRKVEIIRYKKNFYGP